MFKSHSDKMSDWDSHSDIFFNRHGRLPSKHSQWVDGCERMVNSYTEEDRDLMVAAIDSV